MDREISGRIWQPFRTWFTSLLFAYTCTTSKRKGTEVRWRGTAGKCPRSSWFNHKHGRVLNSWPHDPSDTTLKREKLEIYIILQTPVSMHRCLLNMRSDCKPLNANVPPPHSENHRFRRGLTTPAAIVPRMGVTLSFFGIGGGGRGPVGGGALIGRVEL